MALEFKSTQIAHGKSILPRSYWNEMLKSQMQPMEQYLPMSSDCSHRIGGVVANLSWTVVTNPNNVHERILVSRSPLHINNSKCLVNLSVTIVRKKGGDLMPITVKLGLDDVWLSQSVAEMCDYYPRQYQKALLLPETPIPVSKDLLFPLNNQIFIELSVPVNHRFISAQPLPKRFVYEAELIKLDSAAQEFLNANAVELCKNQDGVSLVWQDRRLFAVSRP